MLKGMVIHVENLLYKYSCWKLCQNTEGCIWFSYDYKDWDCFLFESCLEVEENPYFVSSEVACQYSISHSNTLQYQSVVKAISILYLRVISFFRRSLCSTVPNKYFFD